MIVRQLFSARCDSVQTLVTHLQDCCGLVAMRYPNCSVIGLFPKWQLIAISASQSVLLERNGLQQQASLQDGDYLSLLKQQWHHSSAASAESLAPFELASTTVFTGGLMGFIGYDLAASRSVALKHIQSPAAILGDYDIFLKQQPGVPDCWQLYGPDLPELAGLYSHINTLLLKPGLSPAANTSQAHKPKPAFSMTGPFQPLWSFQQYQQAFDKIQDYLKQGDCYQVNLTQPFVAVAEGCLISAIDPLMHLTKAAYTGFIKHADFELLSCSPELFIEFKPAGELVTKPIKGTRPRHHNPDTDAQLKQELLNSEKDRAENLMIVDLLRNDLSIHAKTGSVRVPALFKAESFAQVHHLVSEIRATVHPEVSPLEVLFSALPGGSITGAPKIRAMQIIDELEAQSRGAYCGSMGFLNYAGTGCFNILIRSLQQHGNTVTAWAGGGITIASSCEQEYQECLDKIGAILTCMNQLGGLEAQH